jgi:dienelactone hydrolase
MKNKLKHRAAAVLAILVLMGTTSFAVESLPSLKNNKAPQNLDELWGSYDPRKEPLNTEILKEWEQDGVVARLIRYQVGTFKGSPAWMAAIYCFPKHGTRLPGILHLHGGGQSASLEGPMADARNGYASLSINWGGNKIPVSKSVYQSGIWDGPQTDWGQLDATHPPQRNPINHFPGNLAPDEFTIDAVESPRNSNWFIVLVAARRGLTFLEQQREVDPARIGVTGHSMGGKLTTNLAGIDHRVKAAVPSCGGCGEINISQTDLPGCIKTNIPALERDCISDNAYIPRITCPVLWLSPTNDFHAIIEHMAWNWRKVTESKLRLSITPHRNHLHDDAHSLTRHLFFEQHLKQSFVFPETPQIALETNTNERVPLLRITPDPSRPIKSVDIYYSLDPHPTTRFWRDAKAIGNGSEWTAFTPLMSLDQPLFAYANVTYDTPEIYRNVAHAPGSGNSDRFTISSRVISASPATWQSSAVRATDMPERMIDAGDRGWHDWSLSNWGHPPLWTASTAKLKDPKWRGPQGGTLVFEILSTHENTLAVVISTNAWGVYGKQIPKGDYVATRKLEGSPDWQTIRVSAEDLVSNDLNITSPLADWQHVTDLQLSPTYQGGTKGRVNFPGKAWQGPRKIRNLRWEGGQYATVRPPRLQPE